MEYRSWHRGDSALVLLIEVAFCAVVATKLPAQEVHAVRDEVFTFQATDGTPLEAKLSLPAGARARVPVVYLLHGAGPRNYDHPIRYRDVDGAIKVESYYDYYARELTSRGLALFRISKRGCSIDSLGRSAVDRGIFSNARPSVLIADYISGLEALRRRSEIDSGQIILMAASEGTRLAPEIAVRDPSGIIGLVLTSYQGDDFHGTVVWQNTIGPWRNVKKLIPAADDDALTLAEYESARSNNASLAQRLPFADIDTDSNGVIVPAELQHLLKPRLDALLEAVKSHNEDVIWQAMGNVSSAYLLEDWNGPPTFARLLKLEIPVAVFHGELDGVTRVESALETEAAFKAAGKSNLRVRTYAGHDHDLNWTPQLARAGSLPAMRDAFDYTASLARTRR